MKKKEEALELAQHKAKATPKTFPFPKEGIVFREKKTQRGGSNRYQNPLRFKSPLKRRFRV